MKKAHLVSECSIPQLPIKVKMDEPATIQKLIKAIEHGKSGRAARVDGIPLEL